MAFLKTKVDTETLKERGSSGAKYIYKSGIYPATLKIVSVDVSDNGSTSLNFNVEEENGNQTTFYGLRLTNNDGSENFQAATFHKLAIIAGLEEVSDPETETHKLGKDGKPTELEVLTDFTDLNVKIRVQEEYYKKERGTGDIAKRMVIKNFYRASDGAAAAEIVAEANGDSIEFGTQLSKDEVYASNVTYKDGLTAEDVDAWKETSKNNNKSSGSKAPATKVNKPAGSLFGKK